MNAILKFAIIIGVLLGAGALIGLIIPQQLTNTINNSIVYFIVAASPLQFILPYNTLLLCITILGNFILGIIFFFIIRWIIHITTR